MAWAPQSANPENLFGDEQAERGGHMEVIVEHHCGLQFEIKARHHRIACDQPVQNGGFDEGMTPPELLLGSLGSCAAFYATQYLKLKGLATEGRRGQVDGEKV